MKSIKKAHLHELITVLIFFHLPITGCKKLQMPWDTEDVIHGEDIDDSDGPILLDWNNLTTFTDHLETFSKPLVWKAAEGVHELQDPKLPLPSENKLQQSSYSYLNHSTYPFFLNTLEHLKPFFGGFIGMRGASRVYALENRSSNQGLSWLYPQIIQVLSREYGCFVKKRITWPDQMQFSCRDKRNIVVWHQPLLGWSRLIFRQFDQFGFEIVVRKKMVLRISSRQVLLSPLKPDHAW